ncbi:hypothetical protein AGMMS49965_14630 [Bacteroidia bacterium]|nr:hypothetical protein AGMMS49965_14630 [Bacteroidia bacterium]
MKKTIILFLVAFTLCGCIEEEYYMEGRVNTFDATEIDIALAILNGSLEILHESSKTDCEIVSTGFELSENVHFSNPKTISSGKTRGVFKASAENLKPNTKYYVRAFARLDYDTYNGRGGYDKIFYGNTVEFTTMNGKVSSNKE